MSYIFGEGTPYAYGENRRRIAKELTPPKDHFGEAFSAITMALTAPEKGQEAAPAFEPPQTTGKTAGPFSPPPSAGFKSSVPQGASADTIRSGLLARGMPAHVADAFIVNMQDESGLNPGINEAAPIVPGSRGGFGLYQLTGPRRRDYEAFAASRGVDPADVDAQLDWLMHELEGPEARAAEAIFSAQDTPSAAVAILNKFLRPAEEHRRKREARYWGIG